jgi:hypothetical protein
MRVIRNEHHTARSRLAFPHSPASIYFGTADINITNTRMQTQLSLLLLAKDVPRLLVTQSFTVTGLYIILFSFSNGERAPSGSGPSCCRGFTITDTPHSAGFLWMSDQLDAETST